MAANVTSSFEPYTLHPMPPLIPGISDQHLSLIAPIAVHWLTSGIFEIFERTGWFEQYRLHTTAEELTRNRITRLECLRGTLQGQGLQTLLGLALGSLGDGDVTGSEDYDLAVWIGRVRAVFAALPGLLSVTGIDVKTMALTLCRSGPLLPMMGDSEFDLSSIEVLVGYSLYWYIIPIFQLAIALIVADVSMYCLHRLGHTNKWIYKHIHSHHHRLYIPYSWGGSYNHPFDSLVVDGLSYGLGCGVSGLSIRLSIAFFAYASFKNVIDHCGYVFPWNPIRSVTGADADFHDVHHQSWGLKTNFGAHLTIWDRMMGTYFADRDQISRLRLKNRVAAENIMASQGISTDATDLAVPQCDEKLREGGGGGAKTVTT